MRFTLFAVILIQTFIRTISFAQTPCTFKGENIIIGKYVSILEDPSTKLTFKSARLSTHFILSKTQIPNLNLSSSAFWLKFSIANESDMNQLLLTIEYPTINNCELYSSSNNIISKQTISDLKPFHARKYQHQNFIFDLDIPKHSTRVYYLRVVSTEPMVLPMILGTAQKIGESMLTHDLLWGLLFGLIIVMVLYNLFIYFLTREISYLYYVLYTLFIGLTQATLSGHTYHYIFAETPFLFTKAIIVFPALAGISATLFIGSFLHVKEKAPKFYNLFPIVILFYLIAIVLRILGYDQASYRMIDISALSITIIAYTVAIIILLQGYRPAKIFLIAWTVFLVGLILFILRNSGILPYNTLTSYTMQGGTALEITLLSLALADKINILKAEKEDSQEETLTALKENERIIKEQNTVLELKVSERTSELTHTLDDLKNTQAQLVDSEKMASLGQLTAGIAHEINNPINFVTSNINPLKRDIQDVYQLLEFFEQNKTSMETSFLERVEKLKKDLDIDFVKSEIDLLLKGIDEGANRTSEIIRGLKKFSRVDEQDIKEINLNEGFESTLLLLNSKIKDQIKINLNLGELPQISCYAGKLNQVFMNIISNSIYAIHKKFENKPGGELSIVTKLDRADEQRIEIEIQDNGIGIPEELRVKIFDPFFTTKPIGEGTGLGLSIVQKIIIAHNGTIEVESELGKGTIFKICLPVHQ